LLRRLGDRLQLLHCSRQSLLERLCSGQKLLHRSWQRLLVCLRGRSKLLERSRDRALKRLHCRRELPDDTGERALGRLCYRSEPPKGTGGATNDAGQRPRRSGEYLRGDCGEYFCGERRQERQPDGIAKSVIDDFTHRLWILSVRGTIDLSIRDFMEVSR
jgi:hypothetical protein